jgi:hypothetical protein
MDSNLHAPAYPSQVYALRRLVRGLGSGRQGARQGFATALSLLLSKQADQHSHHGGPFVDAGDVLILIDSCLEAGSSMKAGVSASTHSSRFLFFKGVDVVVYLCFISIASKSALFISSLSFP